MSGGINELMGRVETLEKKIKKEHPNQKGLVLLANAASNASYFVSKKEDLFKWYITYYEELQKV